MNNNRLLIIAMIIALVLFLTSYFILEKYIITSIVCFVGFFALINNSYKVLD